MRFVFLALGLASICRPGNAQSPMRHFTEGVEARFAASQPALAYTITVRGGDTTGFDVRMSVRNAADTFRVALARHPEYDDRFFRFVERPRVSGTTGRSASMVREDSAVWRIIAPGGAATIEYRIAVPQEPLPRAAWRPFLSRDGGLIGGPHAFMYVVGAELAPAHVEVITPWAGISTGLTPTASPTTFFAPNAYVLVESPILAGDLRRWTFTVDHVPHHLTYWGPAGRPAFDTTEFRRGIARMTEQAVRLFGRAPYREYHYQFQDLAWGGLEHHNSVTLGAPADQLAQNPHAYLPEAAHEFVHTWNLMRIRPAEYVGVTYRQIAPVPTLWFSEGLTIFYSDLLLRRAGLPTDDSTRLGHLESIIARFVANPGQSRFSAEQVSRVAYNAAPDALGDYNASSHLTGEVLGAMLDLIVRDATDGRRSMDDVMRLMLERSGERGFTGADIERAVGDVCGCNARPFFEAHVRGAGPVDFNRYLALIGLRATIAMEPSTRDGQPVPDMRLWAWNPPNDTLMALLVNNPQTVWGRAGLHSGERVLAMNGNRIRTWSDFRGIIGRARIGDTVTFVVQRPGAQARTVPVVVQGFDRPVVRIDVVPTATGKQVRLREAWVAGR
jgi:predicted metalloprotease with PDZ domain